MSMKAFTDKPAEKLEEDLFKIEKYISGLSDFIVQCDTPMTIAIQGDWGSGKTSMMNMIKEKLGDKVVPVWFNTWQFSQFNQEEELAFSFLGNLIEALKLNEQTKEIKKTFNLLKAAKFVSVAVTEKIAGEVAAGVVMDAVKLNKSVQELDTSKIISSLKDQFQKAVNDSLTDKKPRVVVFVDDLDRLQPAKAVELLEVLKIFLDCENCVYVLAIDYGVVSQGVKQKYGNTIGEEKGKSFFDKIIQVPFKMPVAQYSVKDYVQRTLQEMDIKAEDKDVNAFVDLIKYSIGLNPRSMKRLFNSFLLLTKISLDDTMKDSFNKKLLFAVLCMQLSYEKLYNYLVYNTQIITSDTLTKLAVGENNSDDQEFNDLKQAIPLTDDKETKQVARFMEKFNSIIDKSGDKNLSDDEIEQLIKILGFSTITSAAEATETTDDIIWHFRRSNRSIVKNINERLKKELKLDFAVYQSNSDRGDGFKFYYAAGYTDNLMIKNQAVKLDYTIKTDLTDQKSYFSMYIAVYKITSQEVFQEIFKRLESEGFNINERDAYKEFPDRIDSNNDQEFQEYVYQRVTALIDLLRENMN